MNMKSFVISIVAITASAMAGAFADVPYQDVVRATAGMVSSQEAQKLAGSHGLSVLNVTWEDTGRYKGSAVGPNISDMTIQVQIKDPQTGKFQLTCMPVIRYPNFLDLSGDIPLDRFYVLVGNEKGKLLKKVTLKRYLEHFREYLTVPSSWKGTRTSLLAKRDTHALVSAQACFLPVPKKGKAEFNPVLFNYQSVRNDPAVLAILATREGTSATIIDNVRDGFQAGMTWGQRLFYNKKGERASFTGTRLSDFNAANKGNGTSGNGSVSAAGEKGLNMVLLIQVPLKQKYIRHRSMEGASGAADYDMCPSSVKMKKSDVEAAVIGHGKVEGPYTEIADLDIERDERFPVRVTVQFYKATSNGAVSFLDMKEISDQIKRVYTQADYAGSLVVPVDTKRPTEYDGNKVQPADWWDEFWKRHKKNTGMTKDENIRMIRELFGKDSAFWSSQEFTRKASPVKKKAKPKKAGA